MKILFIGSRLFDDVAYYLKEKGIYSIITESNENADNLDLADEVFIVPRGMEEPTKIAVSEKVDAVVPLIGIDPPLIDVAYMKEELEGNYGIPVIASDVNAVNLTSDKINTKQFYTDIGVNTPPYKILKKETYKDENLSFPCVLKQGEGQGGKDISVAKSLEDIEIYFETFDEALCEEFVEGSEISIEVIGYNGDYVALTPIYKGETTLEGIHPLSKVKTGPCEIEGLNNIKIQETALKVAKNLNSDGIFEMDFMFSKANKQLYAIEVNTRPNGTRFLTTATCGISSLIELIKMACGEFSSDEVKQQMKSYYSTEIPIGNYNGHLHSEPLKSFDNDDFVVHGPVGYQRITIRGETEESLQKLKEKLIK